MAGELGDTGIEAGDVLIAYAEAVVGDDDDALERARQALLARLGPAALADAAATVASFNSVVRVASATGIPLDEIDETDPENRRLFEELGLDGLKK